MNHRHRRELNECCARTFESQYGVLHRNQALGCGMSENGVASRLASSLWDPLLPGVVRLAGSPRTWLQNLKAAQLWAGPGAAISHRAAAALWRLDGTPQGLVEVTTPHHKTSPIHWVLLHTSKRLGPRDITDHRGIVVATLARTLLDLGAVQRPWRVQSALDHARRIELVSDAYLLAELRRLGGKGCRGIGVIRPMLAEVESGIRAPGSVLERLILKPLSLAGVPDPARQYRLFDHDGVIGDLDLAWPSVRLGLEGDGFDPHMRRSAFHADRVKMNRAARIRWTILRATWEDTKRPERLIETMLSFFPR